jgi:ribosomal protein S18 acetylase RimI-like enzyme
MLSQFNAYKIRKMTKEDSNAVVKLAVDSWKLEYKDILHKDVLTNLSDQKFQEGRKFILSKEDCNCIVATDEKGEIVGFSDAGKSWKSSEEEKEGEIYALYVKSSHQRQSIGRKLFDEQSSYLKGRGFTHMVIWTWENNRKSRSFYEKVGGVHSQTSEKEFEGDKYPSVQYKWPFKK